MFKNKRKLKKLKISATPKATFMLFGILLLIISSVYIGIKQGNIEPYIGRGQETDIFVYNSLFLAEYSLHNLAVNGVHSFLVKWPLFMLQNAIGLNHTLYVVTSVFCMLAMNLSIALLVYFFSRKNLLVTGLLSTGLAIATILVDPSYPYLSLSWLTMRNFELPLLVLFFLLAVRSKRLLVPFSAFIFLLGTLLFISDKVFLYYSVLGLAIYLCLSLLKKHKEPLLNHLPLTTFILGSGLLAYALEFTLHQTGIVLFAYSYNPPSDIVQSVQSLFNQTLDSISATMAVFGADVFNMNVKHALVFLPTLALLVLSAVAIYKLTGRYLSSKATPSPYFKTVLLLISFLIASYLIYILIERTSATHGRFLVFSLPFGVIVTAYFLRDVQIELNLRVLIASIAALSLFTGAAVYIAEKQYATYSEQYGYERPAYETAARIIERMDVGVVSGSAYVQNLQFVHGSLYGKDSLLITNTIKNCTDFGSGLKSNSLYTPSSQQNRTAIYGKGLANCPEERMYRLYGTPITVFPILSSKGTVDMLYIYDYDIRSKYHVNQK